MAESSDSARREGAAVPAPDWRYASHEGSRLAMIERNLKLTVRERLEEMQALNELGAHFRRIERR